jgi:hypothetical protein
LPLLHTNGTRENITVVMSVLPVNTREEVYHKDGKRIITGHS